MKKAILTIVAILAISFSMYSQDKPVRIGIKVGIPNIIGLNGEFVTPIAGNKLAASADFSYFSLTLSGTSVKLSYFELGGNYYLLKEGKGLYTNLSYGRIGTKLEYDDLISDIDPTLTGGSGEASVGVNLVNLKLGAKLGGAFYFRPEIGYAIAAGGGDVTVSATFPDGSTETITEEIPGSASGGFIANIGFGFAF